MGTVGGAGALLRRAREERQESLRTAAHELTVTASHLSRLERGQKNASDDLLRRAAQRYGLPLTILGLSDIPEDVVAILRAHPELIEELRGRFGDEHLR